MTFPSSEPSIPAQKNPPRPDADRDSTRERRRLRSESLLVGAGSYQWYCVRTQSKREHIAAHWLKLQLEIETYLPRIRYRRVEPRGAVWTTEALFPNYLFARCDLAQAWQQVQCIPGVIELVRFGAHCPAIPEEVIECLRAQVGAEEVHVIEEQLVPGDAVQISNGPFHGLEAVVTRVLPARERVRVLLDLLGRRTSVELGTGEVAGMKDARRRVFTSDENGGDSRGSV